MDDLNTSPDIQPNQNDGNVYLATYLLTRLSQLGIRTIHGVKHPPHPSPSSSASSSSLRTHLPASNLSYIETTTAQNAGYAAESYARVNGLSALLASSGAAELAVLNVAAGAFAERVPLVVVVEIPAACFTASVPERGLFSEGEGGGVDGEEEKDDDEEVEDEDKKQEEEDIETLEIDSFEVDVFREFTCAQTILTNMKTAAVEIDYALKTCLRFSKPIYIGIPDDLLTEKISGTPLSQDLDLRLPRNVSVHEDIIIKRLVKAAQSATKPVILVDGATGRCGLKNEVDAFIRLTEWPAFVTPYGKGCVDEELRTFHGVYTGLNGYPGSVEYVTSADLVVVFGKLDVRKGSLEPGYNSFRESTSTSTSILDFDMNRIAITNEYITVKGHTFYPRNTQALVRKFLSRLDQTQTRYNIAVRPKPYPDLPQPANRPAFWLQMSTFLRANDVIISDHGNELENGNDGSPNDLVLPATAKMVSSAWMATSYAALPAAIGACLAQRDNNKSGRTIIFTTPHALEAAAHCLHEIFKRRLHIIIFIINNTTKHTGPRSKYTNPLSTLHLFGAPQTNPEYPVTTKQVPHPRALMGVLMDPSVRAGKGFCLVEILAGGNAGSGPVIPPRGRGRGLEQIYQNTLENAGVWPSGTNNQSNRESVKKVRFLDGPVGEMNKDGYTLQATAAEAKTDSARKIRITGLRKPKQDMFMSGGLRIKRPIQTSIPITDTKRYSRFFEHLVIDPEKNENKKDKSVENSALLSLLAQRKNGHRLAQKTQDRVCEVKTLTSIEPENKQFKPIDKAKKIHFVDPPQKEDAFQKAGKVTFGAAIQHNNENSKIESSKNVPFIEPTRHAQQALKAHFKDEEGKGVRFVLLSPEQKDLFHTTGRSLGANRGSQKGEDNDTIYAIAKEEVERAGYVPFGRGKDNGKICSADKRGGFARFGTFKEGPIFEADSEDETPSDLESLLEMYMRDDGDDNEETGHVRFEEHSTEIHHENAENKDKTNLSALEKADEWDKIGKFRLQPEVGRDDEAPLSLGSLVKKYLRESSDEDEGEGEGEVEESLEKSAFSSDTEDGNERGGRKKKRRYWRALTDRWLRGKKLNDSDSEISELII
ncbi:hypothetical protein BDV18DRAFT_163598 [Aspergillus unguis]